MFGKRITPTRRRSKTRPKARVEQARRIPKAPRRAKKVRPAVVRQQRQEEERQRRQNYQEAMERWRSRNGMALETVRAVRAAYLPGPWPLMQSLQFYEPYREKVNWKKEGF